MSPAAAAPLLALLAAAAATAAAADFKISDPEYPVALQQPRDNRAIGNYSVPNPTEQSESLGVGCIYEGQWFRDGARVSPREPCLRCACARGALSCRRRACAAPPAPPPRCHLRYRRDACCPEIHCPDRIIVLEEDASARSEDEEEIATPTSISHACVEGGVVWAAGSALGARAACEACFCLAGERRCVRPRCLPPPPGCRAPPAPGHCCPHRYYCRHDEQPSTPDRHRVHDCNVNGTWVTEGARAAAAEGGPCSRCFCLRGAVRCQPLQCAPALRGCTPLVRDNDCCPHQYHCHHRLKDKTSLPSLLSQNALVSEKNEFRSFDLARSSKTETPAKPTSFRPTKSTPKSGTVAENLETTVKVKRKTNETQTTLSSSSTFESTTVLSTITSTSIVDPSTTEVLTNVKTTTDFIATTDQSSDTTTTEQADESVRIMINGTINCTSELSSSTAIPLNSSLNETHKIIQKEDSSQTTTKDTELQSSIAPVEIITNRYIEDGLDENESFTINVTSSLFQNKNQSAMSKPNLPKVPDFEDIMNASSKKTNGDYDFDYTEPTLPPSLPNLKIIPFVAADAVVDEDEPVKEEITYPMLEREDKYPVYYPSVETKDTFATRREDAHAPTQYPVFHPGSVTSSKHPGAHEVDLTNSIHSGVNDDLDAAINEYTITASLGHRLPVLSKAVTRAPTTTTTFNIEVPAVNLFSPPVETEGGFIPKGPGIIDEYYAVYPSTPQAPSVPHLTTSMQLDTKEGECFLTDGRRIVEGDTISIACSICTCAWAELHCSPRPCPAPPGCARRPAASSSADPCCGQLVCGQENQTPPTVSTTRKSEIILNETIAPQNISTTIDKITTTPPAILNEKISTDFNNTEKHMLNFSTENMTTTSPPATTKSVQTKSVPNTHVMKNTTTKAAVSTIATTSLTTSTPAWASHNESAEYEDEDDDDGGFSFGSVLKLLLSESYDTTTTVHEKKFTTAKPTKPPKPTAKPPNWETSRPSPSTTKKPTVKPSIAPFIPMSPHYSYSPPKKASLPPTVNRIDHLILGEASAIKITTPRPYIYPAVATSSVPMESMPPFSPVRASSTTTQRPFANARPADAVIAPSQPAAAAPAGAGSLLKLAGCNIYGRMYRVGRIIAELSTPCQECRCTEAGVHCRALPC